MINRNSLIIFLILSFLTLFGIEFGVIAVFYFVLNANIFENSVLYLSALWSIIVLRFFIILYILNRINLNFSSLLKGTFNWRALLIATVIVSIFIFLESIYLHSFEIQILGEYHTFLKLGRSTSIATVLLISQYIYYFVEILAVNLLYLGAVKFTTWRDAILAPVFLWGFMHILNFFKDGVINAILLGIYMALFALAMYSLAAKYKNLKIPIYMWFLQLIL